MAKQGQAASFDALATFAETEGRRGIPPVHLWNPPFCGDLDIRIAADGTWYYLGTPIARPELVRLFSSILKREGDRYFLVTPVEKVGIKVDDVPFQAVEMQRQARDGDALLSFRTNVGEWIACDHEHPLRFEPAAHGGLTPYLHVRAQLWARVARALYYDLVDLGETRLVDGRELFGVVSDRAFFRMAEAEQMKGDGV